MFASIHPINLATTANKIFKLQIIWKLPEFLQHTATSWHLNWSIVLFIASGQKTQCAQLTRFLVQCLWNYIFRLDWTSAMRLADLCSISFSSWVNGCFTMCVTPFSPRTQGRDRNTSLSMPCWPCKIRRTNFSSETTAHFSLPIPISI